MRRFTAAVVASGLGVAVLASPVARAGELDASYWAPSREVMVGLRSTNATIESILSAIKTAHAQPGQTYTIATPPAGLTTTSMKVKLTATTGAYKYLLEIWGLVGGSYLKGVEFHYNDSNTGELVIRPWVFQSAAYHASRYVKATYAHTAAKRSMVIDVIEDQALKSAKARYLVTQEDGVVTVYFAGNRVKGFDRSSAGIANGILDAYLLGVKVKVVGSARYTTAKFGLVDTGADHDFTLYGYPNLHNPGWFTEDGLGSEGVGAGSASFPDPATIVETGLPSSAEVEGVQVAFASEDPPSF